MSYSKLEEEEVEYCDECFPGFKYDKSKKICAKSKSIMIFYIILSSFIVLVLIFTLIMFFVYKHRRRNLYLCSNSISRNNRLNNDNMIWIQNIENLQNSQSLCFWKFNKEELEDEFEIQKGKWAKDIKFANFAKKSQVNFHMIMDVFYVRIIAL